MDRDRWLQIRNGMVKNGWQCVVEIHPNIPEDVRTSLTSDYKTKYKDTHEMKWYHNHNAYNCLFVRKLPPRGKSVLDNVYREPIIKRVDTQTQKGIDKYGTVLPQNDAPLLERMEHKQQELTDALVYGEWITDGLITLGRHMAQLKTHLDGAYIKVHGLSPENPMRSNHEKAMSMVEHMMKELGGLGKSK